MIIRSETDYHFRKIKTIWTKITSEQRFRDEQSLRLYKMHLIKKEPEKDVTLGKNEKEKIDLKETQKAVVSFSSNSTAVFWEK